MPGAWAGGRRSFSRGAYCLGKVVWGKGWEQLLRLLAAHDRTHPDNPCPLDAFGEGEALASVCWQLSDRPGQARPGQDRAGQGRAG